MTWRERNRTAASVPIAGESSSPSSIRDSISIRFPGGLPKNPSSQPTPRNAFPVIVDGGRGVADSWAIANYLEDTYRDRPLLFGSGQERALARFYNQWTDVTLHGAIGPLVVPDILEHLDARDRDYFRASREARLGTKLEALKTRRENYLSMLQQVLEPLRQTLAAQPYLAGDTPGYPDFIVFGAFQWARSISALRIVQPSDPIDSWRQRLLDAFDSFARSAPGYW
jgi:glutathione S-transferase